MPSVPPSSARSRRPSRLALAYLLALLLIWALSEWVAERTLPTLLLAYAPPLLWLALALPVWLWVLLRRRKPGMALLATLLAFWSTGLLHWRPQSAGDLRILTYNVAGGRNTTPEQLAAYLLAQNADIILLQESNYTRPAFGPAFEKAMKGYALAHAAEVTTLSRLPLGPETRFDLPQNRREVLLTPISWKGRTLNVLNAHLGTVMLSPLLKGDLTQARRTRNARSAQVDVLRRVALQTSGPVLLGGDLNTPPRGLIYRRLRDLFGPDAHARAGRGPGWTFPSLKTRIDHQLTRDLTPTRARVLGGVGSDHLPLLVEYRWP